MQMRHRRRKNPLFLLVWCSASLSAKSLAMFLLYLLVYNVTTKTNIEWTRERDAYFWESMRGFKPFTDSFANTRMHIHFNELQQTLLLFRSTLSFSPYLSFLPISSTNQLSLPNGLSPLHQKLLKIEEPSKLCQLSYSLSLTIILVTRS